MDELILDRNAQCKVNCSHVYDETCDITKCENENCMLVKLNRENKKFKKENEALKKKIIELEDENSFLFKDSFKMW